MSAESAPRNGTGIRVMIHGSCVSRDLLSFHPELGEVSDYVARQSWLSQERPWPVPAVPDGLASSFRLRQLRADFEGNGRARVATAMARGDNLLLDLCDERLGVHVDLAGRVVTASQELRESAWHGSITQCALHLRFGESEHLEAWTLAARGLRDLLTSGDAMARTVLLALPFADQDETGTELAGSLGRTVDEWNAAYAPYYRVARELGFHTVGVSRVTADSLHQWGRAPFHYTREVYAEVAHRIMDHWSGDATLSAAASHRAGPELTVS